MAKAPPSLLLEQLRAQADAVAARRVQQVKLSREVVDRVDMQMQQAFAYFDEACRRLQTLMPPVERRCQLPHAASYEGLRVERALDFESVALDTPALDELVQLILAKPSQFLLRAPLRGFFR